MNGWIREKEKRVVTIRGRGESPQREKGVSGLRGRRIMPPPLSPTNTDIYFRYPLTHSRTWLLCLSLYFVESLFEKSLFEKSVDFASSKKKKRLDNFSAQLTRTRAKSMPRGLAKLFS